MLVSVIAGLIAGLVAVTVGATPAVADPPDPVGNEPPPRRCRWWCPPVGLGTEIPVPL